METRKIEAAYYCGVDMHSRTSYICVLNRSGEIEYKRNIKNSFQTFKAKSSYNIKFVWFQSEG